MTQITFTSKRFEEANPTKKFWNGFEFTTKPCKLKGDISNHANNAMAWMMINASIAYYVIFIENNPAAYNYSIQ